MAFKISFVLLVCVFAYRIEAQDCEDKLNSNYWLNVLDSDDNVVATLYDCNDVVTDFLGLCEDPSIGGDGGLCCQSCPDTTCLDLLSRYQTLTLGNKVFKNCSDIITDEYRALCLDYGAAGDVCCDSCSTQDLDCVDQLKSFMLNGKTYKNCAKFIKKNPCMCRDEEVADDCCSSCSKTDYSFCSCQDLLNKNNELVFFKDKSYEIQIKNCKTLANKYPVLCDTYGGEDGLCCKSCDGVDTSCVDKIKVWTGGDGKFYKDCKSLIKDDPCRCEDPDIASDCCHTCSGVDLPALRCGCTDTVSKDNPITITNPDGSKTVIKSCNLLVKKYKVLCETYGGPGNRCCRSCEDVDLSCVDQLFYFTSSSGKVYKSCKLYTKAKPCACYDSAVVAADCCESCAAIDTTGCGCRDKVSKQNPITVTTKDGNGIVISEVTVNSCSKMVLKFPQLCADYGGPDNACCASCP